MEKLTLSENQIRAIKHFNEPMMVLAGPGSGKTTVITYRVKNLIEEFKVPPSEILVITFTKAASVEMANRFANISHGIGGVTFATFHSFFFRVIRGVYGYEIGNVLTTQERREIVKGIIENHQLSQEGEEDFLQSVLNEISLVKNEMIPPHTHNSACMGNDDFLSLYNEYEKCKSRINKIDFDDMQQKCYELITNNPEITTRWRKKYPYILVDEFQDINHIQYECIKIFANPRNNIFIVGDDDQSIYKFRGARPEFLLNFPKDFKNCSRAILNINYRSTERIIEACNKIIKENKIRYDKNIIGTNREGKPLYLMKPKDVSEEAKTIATIIKKSAVPLKEIAVLYRTNIQARAFVDAFLDMNIPYQLKDEMPGIYEHWIAKDLCAYLNLSLNRGLNDELARIINKPKRYISRAILHSAKKRGGRLLDNLCDEALVQKWQLARMEELIFYLNAIRKRNPKDAIRFIRQGVGYEDYLREYAEFRKTSSGGMFEVLDELTEAAKGYDTIEDFLQHVEEVVLSTKEKKAPKGKQKAEGVTLSTMHSAKGLEYDMVFVTSAVEGVIPHERSKTPSEIEEERRLFYVAATRARENLYISLIKSRYERETVVTRFLNI